jgi:hypothetical protein
MLPSDLIESDQNIPLRIMLTKCSSGCSGKRFSPLGITKHDHNIHDIGLTIALTEIWDRDSKSSTLSQNTFVRYGEMLRS